MDSHEIGLFNPRNAKTEKKAKKNKGDEHWNKSQQDRRVVREELGFLFPKSEIWHKPQFFIIFFLVILRKISVYLAENKQKTPQSSTPRSTAFKKSDRSTKENKIPQTYHIHKDEKKLAFLSLTSSGNLPQAATQVWKCNFTAIVVVEFLLTRIFIIKITLQPCSNF